MIKCVLQVTGHEKLITELRKRVHFAQFYYFKNKIVHIDIGSSVSIVHVFAGSGDAHCSSARVLRVLAAHLHFQHVLRSARSRISGLEKLLLGKSHVRKPNLFIITEISLSNLTNSQLTRLKFTVYSTLS